MAGYDMFQVDAIHGDDERAVVVPSSQMMSERLEDTPEMKVIAQRLEEVQAMKVIADERKALQVGDTLTVVADGGGLRHNTAKTRLELVPPEWTWALADVTTMGSFKYAERNWERGMKWSIMIGCAARHIAYFMIGRRYDAETGCHHLAMAAWNLLALLSYDLRGIGEVDLPGVEAAVWSDDAPNILVRVNSGNPTSPAIRDAMGLPEIYGEDSP